MRNQWQKGFHIASYADFFVLDSLWQI